MRKRLLYHKYSTLRKGLHEIVSGHVNNMAGTLLTLSIMCKRLRVEIRYTKSISNKPMYHVCVFIIVSVTVWDSGKSSARISVAAPVPIATTCTTGLANRMATNQSHHPPTHNLPHHPSQLLGIYSRHCQHVHWWWLRPSALSLQSFVLHILALWLYS